MRLVLVSVLVVASCRTSAGRSRTARCNELDRGHQEGWAGRKNAARAIRRYRKAYDGESTGCDNLRALGG
jgi:hypothetical protein